MPTATSNFLIPNATLIVEVIAFLIVLAVVARYILPPLNRALSERQEQIRGEMAAADRAKADAQAADEERRAELDSARSRAREIVEQANRTSDRVNADARSRGQAEYDRIVSSADAEVRLARQRAVEEASDRLGQLVVDTVERIIGREMDSAAHRDLIDEAVAALRRDTESTDATAAQAGSGT